MERAITGALAGGDYLQAIANAERMRSSASVSLDDTFVVRRLDEAWEKYIAAQIGDGAPSLDRLRKLDWAARVTREHRVPNAAEYEKRLDDMVRQMIGGHTGTASYGLVADIASAAPSSRAARDAVSALEKHIEGEVAKLGLTGTYGEYVRGLLLHYYGIRDVPPHPHVVSLSFATVGRGGQCEKAIDATRKHLATGAGRSVSVELEIASCDTRDVETTSARQFEYQSPVKVKRKVRKLAPREVKTTRRVCANVGGGCSPSWGVGGTSTSQAGACWQTTRCEDEESTRTVYEEVNEEVWLDDVETLLETVRIVTRTTTARLRGTMRLTLGEISATLPIDVEGEASSEQFRAEKSSASSSYRPTGDEAIENAARTLALQIEGAGQAGARQDRVREIDPKLATSRGNERTALLVEWTANAGQGHPELVSSFAGRTDVPRVDLENALAGRTRATKVVAAFDVYIVLPSYDVAGANGLIEDESRVDMNGRIAHVAAAMLGVLVDYNDGSKFGGGLVARWSKTAGFFAFRPVVPYVFVEGAFDVAAGSGAGGVAFGYDLYGGVGLVAGAKALTGGPFVFAGPDGIWLSPNDDETPLPDDAVRAPVSLSWGYGAQVSIARTVMLRASRAMRSDDTYPERWVGELSVRRSFYSIGGRATVFDTLLDREAATRGPWQAMLFVSFSTEYIHFTGALPSVERTRQ